jgi:lysophospholipid acyltransferase (LPLAT)-like uncharacterized protein
VPVNPPRVNAARQARVICKTRAELNTPPEQHVNLFPLWQRAAVWPLAALVRLWAMTIRITLKAEELQMLSRHGDPIIFVIWHNRLFMGAELMRRFRRGHRLFGLISASRDGAWLSAFFSACGLNAVRGSTSRYGREAAKELVETLRSGNDVGIAPDGPRGPVYEMKPGALIVARRARSTAMLVGVDYESSWRFPSWDGFHLPRPFSRMHLRFVIVEVDPRDDRDEAALRMGALLAKINPDRRPAPVRRRE